MKRFPVILFLTSVTAFCQDAPPVTSAAKVKPSSKWEDYPTRLVGSLPDYKSASDGELSNYGGLKSTKHDATGFFHAQKTGSRWWLVDPKGHPFIHVGVVAVAPPGGKETTAGWGEVTSELLHAHGFNGTGAWSENEQIRASKRPVVYTKIWNFMKLPKTDPGRMAVDQWLTDRRKSGGSPASSALAESGNPHTGGNRLKRESES